LTHVVESNLKFGLRVFSFEVVLGCNKAKPTCWSYVWSWM